MDTNQLPPIEIQKSARHMSGRIFAGIVLVIFLMGAFIYYVRAPKDFPVAGTITVLSGDNSVTIAKKLEEKHAIRSSFLFASFLTLFGDEHKVPVGEYYFDTPRTVVLIAWQIAHGNHNIKPIKVTIPEGYTVREIAELLQQKIPDFNTVEFKKIAKNDEGYLFPETYFFYPHVTPEEVLVQMKDMFLRIASKKFDPRVIAPHSKEEILIMASIVEREAHGDNDRATIAGILWSRLSQGIPLQVDASVLYALDKNSGLTKADMRVDSAFNTYIHKGLPPAPISNPGLKAIEASIHPVSSAYLYYLHDATGQIHYAKTYAEHLKNIQKYLR